ncbi:MAG: Bug family tripartite tricarboxylate transporter substrate binding protein [Beijerinckiaceae bacterium]
MSRSIRSIRLLALASLAALGLVTGTKSQEAYPNKPIMVIVPYAPGGNTDVIARIVLDHMATTLKQPMVVENIGGAGGTTGSLRGARSAPDGYTLLVGQMGTHGAAPALYPTLAYNPVTDFEHISQLTDTPIAVFVRKTLPVNTLAELITMLKANPGKLNNGHGGVGATSHVSCLLFSSVTGTSGQLVPYRGSGPALNDLIAGTHDYMCDQIPHTVSHVLGGSIKALALASDKRADVLPQVPTTVEAGLPVFQASGWNAMFAPKGTAKPIVDRLAQAVSAALDDPATKAKLEGIGAIIPQKRGSDALRSMVASEVEKWTPVIRGANVKVQ